MADWTDLEQEMRNPMEENDRFQIIKTDCGDLHLPLKYRLGQRTSTESYDVTDVETNQKYAMQLIRWNDSDWEWVDAEITHIRISAQLSHPMILSIFDIVPPPTMEFSRLIVMYQRMETDMHRVLRSRSILTVEHVQYFSYQLFCGLCYLHSAGVIHGDLKPSNLLLNSQSDLKITGFHKAIISQQESYLDHQYPLNRWYRSIDLALGASTYNHGVDMWAAGCIMAEMFTRKPLFPGRDAIELIRMIVAVIDPVSEQKVDEVKLPVKAKEFLFSIMEKVPRQTWDQLIPSAPSSAMDIIQSLIKFDPQERPAAAEVLQSTFFAELHDPNSEEEAKLSPHQCVVLPDLANMTAEKRKECLLQDMCRFHPEYARHVLS